MFLSTGNTGMTNVGQVDLPTGVPAQYSAAIDPTTGFGYFGSASGANPGIVSKINLNGPLPTVVQDGLANSIPSGISNFNAMLVDTTNADPTKHYIYVGATGGRILKMSPGDSTHDPQMLATLTPTSVTGGIFCGAIDTSSFDPTQRFAYFGFFTNGTAPKVLRVRLSDFTEDGVETLNMANIRTCAIDTIHHYLYFTTFGSPAGTGPQIGKVNLATFTDGGTSTATYNMGSATPGDGITVPGFNTPGFDIGLTIDPVHQFAYMGSLGGSNDPVQNNEFPNNQSVIVRINLGNGDAFPAHPISVLPLNVGERDLTAAVFDAANGNVYFGTDLTYPGHVYMIHVGDGTQPMTEVGRLDMNLGTDTNYPPDGTVTALQSSTPEGEGEIFFRSMILDSAQNALYIGTDGRPGQIIKVGINGAPPQLTSVVSRKIESGGNDDLNLSLSSAATIDPRVGGPSQIVFNFSEPVHAADGTLDASEFTIMNASFSSVTIAGNSILLNLSNVQNAHDVTVALSDIIDASGNTMFGPKSVTIGALAGDANQDGRVNAADFSILASNYGSASASFVQGDFDGDGNVTALDFNELAAGFNTSLNASGSTSLLSGPANAAAPLELFNTAPLRDDSITGLMFDEPVGF